MDLAFSSFFFFVFLLEEIFCSHLRYWCLVAPFHTSLTLPFPLCYFLGEVEIQ